LACRDGGNFDQRQGGGHWLAGMGATSTKRQGGGHWLAGMAAEFDS